MKMLCWCVILLLGSVSNVEASKDSIPEEYEELRSPPVSDSVLYNNSNDITVIQSSRITDDRHIHHTSSDVLPFFHSFVNSINILPSSSPVILSTTCIKTRDSSEYEYRGTAVLPTEREISSSSSMSFSGASGSSSWELLFADRPQEWPPLHRITQSGVIFPSSELWRRTAHLDSTHDSSRTLPVNRLSLLSSLSTAINPTKISDGNLGDISKKRNDVLYKQVPLPRQVYDPYNVTENYIKDAFKQNVHVSSPPVNYGEDIVVGRRCHASVEGLVWWNDTDGGMLALKTCPSGYKGNAYRPCYTSGKWGKVDYSECRLDHLGRVRHAVDDHIHKGLLSSLHHMAEELSRYLSAVEMKSPMDRLEAFDIVNTLLKVNMNLRLDKLSDVNYVQALLRCCDELLTRKRLFFSAESAKNNQITKKAAEMVFDLTLFAERALRGLLKTKKKQIAFRSAKNVVLYLYRGKLNRSGLQSKINASLEYGHDGEPPAAFILEEALEKSAYALTWIHGVKDLLSNEDTELNSDIAVAAILSPSDSLSRLRNPPTFDIGLRMEKFRPLYKLAISYMDKNKTAIKSNEHHDDIYSLECGILWNTSWLWNTNDCFIESKRGNIVTCRCRHLGSIGLLLKRKDDSEKFPLPSLHVGKLIISSCVASLIAIMLTFVVNIFHYRREPPHSSLLLLNLLISMATTQIVFMAGINATSHQEVCYCVALFLHYLFLATCFWLVSYSIHILKKLRFTTRSTTKVRDYCLFSWVLPVALVIISLAFNPRGYEVKRYCWLTIQRGMLLSFIVPVTSLILINTVVMVLVLKNFNDQISVTHKTEICKTRTSMRAGVTLLPFFSVNWFFGVLAVEDASTTAFQVSFALTNSLQGFLMFVFFCAMDSDIRQSFRTKIVKTTKKPKVSSMKLKKSNSFPIRERATLASLTEDVRRLDSQPLLSTSLAYSPITDDPCCSNIRV